MADTRLRSGTRREDESPGLLARPSRQPPPRATPGAYPAWSLPLALGLLLGGTLTAVYWWEQLTLLTAILIGGSAVGLVVTWDALRTRRLLAATLLLNVALVLLYFWSLDETHHVAVRVTPRGFVASVDGDTLALPAIPLGGQFGLQASPLLSYRVQATGEALQTDTQSLFARLAATTRLAQPAPAWANLRIQHAGAPRLDSSLPRLELLAGSWSTNRRGELQGSPSGYFLFAPVRAGSYVISVDVRRPDGTQSILVDVGRHGDGYALELRFDQPDLIWTNWRNGVAAPGLESTRLRHLAFVPELQRVTRVVLTGYLFALLFAALAIGLYPILFAAFRLLSGRSRDEWASLAKPLHAPWFVWVVFALIGAAALVLTTLVSSNLLDRIPHVQDSVAYLFQAKILASGAFNVRPPPAAVQSFFSEQFVPVFQGKWFSQYPPGHSLVLMVGALAGAPWLVGPVLASISLGCIFLLGRRLYGAGIGLLAALLGLSSPFWLFLGSEFMSHSTGLFFAVTFLLCFAQTESDDASRVWPFLAGFLAAMLFITRELTAVGVIGPFIVYAILVRRQMWRRYLPALGGAAIPLGFLLFYNWIQMGSPFTARTWPGIAPLESDLVTARQATGTLPLRMACGTPIKIFPCCYRSCTVGPTAWRLPPRSFPSFSAPPGAGTISFWHRSQGWWSRMFSTGRPDSCTVLATIMKRCLHCCYSPAEARLSWPGCLVGSGPASDYIATRSSAPYSRPRSC